MVVSMGLFAFSRLHIFGTIFLASAAGFLIFIVFYLKYGKDSPVSIEEIDGEVSQKQRISIRLLIADFFIVNVSFFLVNYLRIESFYLGQGNEVSLLMLYGMWFISAIVTRKFDKDSAFIFFNAIMSCLKSVALIAVIFALIIFSLRLDTPYGSQILGTLVLIFIFEIFVYSLYAANKKEQASTNDVESIEQVKAYIAKVEKSSSFSIVDDCNPPEDPVGEKLETALDFFNPWLFEFIHNGIDLSTICKSKTWLLNSENPANLKFNDDSALLLIINLYRLNHFRRLNQYFLEIHSKLQAGGYFIGKVSTIRTYNEKVKEKYPKYLSNFLYALHFLFYRIAPKLPVTKQIYFGLTQGRDRIVSRAEVLGRLCFCGFEIVAEKEIDYELYYIARKIKMPSTDKNPSYGPIVSMNRYGLNGKPISVYKFRTMYSYSEFLQDYIHKLNKLQDGGKFNEDFRITTWGRFMRKLWLDELPMLYNWLRGDLQFVGVRPLSYQYFSLYSNDLQELRSRVKPGLIPPFYADLPITFEEICDSEGRYIRNYLKRPIRTQWIYFWKAIHNIVVKGARSN
jgi:uncharacterized membrane protein